MILTDAVMEIGAVIIVGDDPDHILPRPLLPLRLHLRHPVLTAVTVDVDRRGAEEEDPLLTIVLPVEEVVVVAEVVEAIAVATTLVETIVVPVVVGEEEEVPLLLVPDREKAQDEKAVVVEVVETVITVAVVDVIANEVMGSQWKRKQPNIKILLLVGMVQKVWRRNSKTSNEKRKAHRHHPKRPQRVLFPPERVAGEGKAIIIMIDLKVGVRSEVVVENEREAVTTTAPAMIAATMMTTILHIPELVIPLDATKAVNIVIAIDRRLGEAKDEGASLPPMIIIDMEIVTIPMIGAAIGTSVAPKRRNEEVLLPKKKGAAGAIVNLQVVIICPRRGGIIEIVIKTRLRLRREINKNITTTLRNRLNNPVAEKTEIMGLKKMLSKKIYRCHHLRQIHERL